MSIVLGVAAMVAVGSFGSNLTTAVEEQSKALLGADLEVATRIPFTPEQVELLDALGVHPDLFLLNASISFGRQSETRPSEGTRRSFPLLRSDRDEPT